MSIAKNTLANLMGGILPLLVTVVTVPIYLKVIGEERYGTLAVIWVLLSYFSFFNFGLGKATAQRIARLGSEQQAADILWTAMLLTAVLGIVGGLTLWAVADLSLQYLVSISDSGREEALQAVPWLMAALPVLLVTSVMSGALQAREKFFQMNIVAITTNVLNQIVPLIIAQLGHQELAYLVPSAFVGSLSGIFWFYLLCKKHVPLTAGARFERMHLRPLLNYGGGVTLISLLAPLLISIDRLFIASVMGSRAVAYYTIPYTLVTRLQLISGSLSGAIFPRLASHAAEHELNALAMRSTQSLISVMTPLVIAGMFFVQPFLNLWLGSAYAEHTSHVGEILLIGVWINGFAVPHFSRLQATGKLRGIVFIYLIEIPVYLLMLWMALQRWGIAGAAAAWSSRILLDTLLMLLMAGALRQTLMQSLYPIALVCTSTVLCFSLEHNLTTALIFVIPLLASLYLARTDISRISELMPLRRKTA